MKRTRKFLAVFAAATCILAAAGESRAAERRREHRNPAGGRSGAVTLYEDKNYRGRSQTLHEGRYRLGALRIENDSLSSIRVREGYQVILFQHDNFQGSQKTVTGDIAWLGAFNDETSSIVVMKISQPRPGPLTRHR
jgi:hypothetical protein